MTAIAVVGKRLLPSATDVSVTLVRAGRAETVASTGTLAAQMDERQYEDGHGPCLTAATTGSLVSLPDAAGTQRWPDLAAAARRRGIGSSLSIPVSLPEPVSAGLNLYSERRDGFPEPDVELARTLAAYAAVALTNVPLSQTSRKLRDAAQALVDSATAGSSAALVRAAAAPRGRTEVMCCPTPTARTRPTTGPG